MKCTLILAALACFTASGQSASSTAPTVASLAAASSTPVWSTCPSGDGGSSVTGCGVMCEAYGSSNVGSCSSEKWDQNDFDGSCGSTVERACHVAVSSKFDADKATCGKCYKMTNKIDSADHTTFLKVIDIDQKVKHKDVKFSIPTNVFAAACPAHCVQGGCKKNAESASCSSSISDDCAYGGTKDYPTYSHEVFQFTQVDCKSGNASSAFTTVAVTASALLALSLGL